ncbi:hypothetical protein NMY22_g16750 [Coprinellus aureogranulatus]|nr:hypothetical protein NMY22_g16750 [Coprinellus aureogranulatus]
MDVDPGVVDSPIDFSDEIPLSSARKEGEQEKEEKVEEEYMPPKMRKKLRSRMLEELKRIVGKGDSVSPASPVAGLCHDSSQQPPDGLQPEASRPRPPTSASPSASFAKLSLFTPLPRPTNPIDASTSSPQRLPPRGNSGSPTPSPAKGERSRIPLSDVRGEPAPPLPTRKTSTAAKPEKTTVKRNAQSTGSPPSSPVKKVETKSTSPVFPRQPLPSSPSKSKEKEEKEEGEYEEGEVEEGGGDGDGDRAMDIDVDGKETEVIPDTPLSPPPSTRASTTASTPPPRPPPRLPTTTSKTSTEAPRKSSPTKEIALSRASPAIEADVLRPPRSKKMDVHSLVNSEASTPNMVVRRELEASPPPVSVSQDEDVEMGEVQEDNALSKPVEPASTSLMVSTSNANPQSISDSKADPLSEETQSKTDAIPAREPTPPPAIPKAPTPPPPPPQKVKLSLKDFAARRKKQKEEEEKHRKEEGGAGGVGNVNPPIRPTGNAIPSSASASANLASSTPSAANTAPPSSSSAVNGVTSSSANGTFGERKGETMTKEVKKEAVQDILMRPCTPEREEGEEVEGEHGIPGLVLSPRSKARLAPPSKTTITTPTPTAKTTSSFTPTSLTVVIESGEEPRLWV